MAEFDSLDLFALMRECKRVGLNNIIDQHILGQQFFDSEDNYGAYVQNIVCDVQEMRPLPDTWMQLCKSSGYNVRDELARCPVGWLCAIHGVCNSWKRHRNDCSTVSVITITFFPQLCHSCVCVYVCRVVQGYKALESS